MREDEPRDPSLALCQICGMKGEMGVYTIGCDGKPHHYRTCVRYTIGNCNHFIPGNIGNCNRFIPGNIGGRQ